MLEVIKWGIHFGGYMFNLAGGLKGMICIWISSLYTFQQQEKSDWDASHAEALIVGLADFSHLGCGFPEE